ncbi:MAG: hypothetical protein IJB44_07715 [Clostridia bacterium]|nr:hypothetical protein [Clostridia bacterium]
MSSVKFLIKIAVKFGLLFAGLVYAMIFIIFSIVFAHGAVVYFNEGQDFLTTINSVLDEIIAENWHEVYRLTRQTVLLELPIVGIADKMFITQSGDITISEIFLNLIKAIISGFFSYILCRINILISSANHKLLFVFMCGLWDRIAQIGTVVLIAWINILDPPIFWVVLLVIVILMFLLNSFLPYDSLNNRQFVLIGMKKCFDVNIRNLLSGILDGIFISFIIYILHNILIPNMTNQIETAFIFIMICFVTTIIFEFLKRNILKL